MGALYAHLKEGAFSKKDGCDEDDPLEGILDIVRDGKTVAKIVLVLEHEGEPDKLTVHLMYGPTDDVGFTTVEERTFRGAVAMGLLELCGRALAATGDLADKYSQSGPPIRITIGS